MSEPRFTSTARVVFDDRGNPVWEWLVDGHYEKDVDTKRLKTLLETAKFSVLEEPASAGDSDQSAPEEYFEAGPRNDPAAGRRRSPDDMRRLSEEIKRQRDKKTG
jgi:hypothetical protein